MKKTLFIIGILLATSSFCQEWIKITDDIDLTMFKKNHSRNSAWFKIVYKEPRDFGNDKLFTKTVISLYKFKCRKKKKGLLKLISYAENGQVIQSFDYPKSTIKMKISAPDSVGEFIQNSFCNGKKLKLNQIQN